MQRTILLDTGKLKKLNSGLGQFSLSFGNHIVNIHDPSMEWHFLVPGSAIGIFGQACAYESLSLRRRYIPSTCKNYDLWHALHQDSAFMPGHPETAYILTIHDLNFLVEKSVRKAENRRKQLQKKVDRATAITFISKHTAEVAGNNLDLDGKDLHLIYNGVDIETGRKGARPPFVPQGKFLFAIGIILSKKNFHVLIDLLRHLPEYHLVMAGDNSSDYARDIQRKIGELDLRDRIHLPGEISDAERSYLYQHCEAFLFPSIAEGFGMPVIEAMRFGKPVFLSRYASLPEIGSDLAYYWDSFNPEHMTDRFRKGMEEFEKNKSRLSRKIMDHSLRFNWKSSIQKYHELYEKVLKERYQDANG